MALKHFKHLPLVFMLIISGIVLVNNVQSQELPISKFGATGAPTITFLYCYSCGYKKAYDEYENILLDKYPDIVVRGGNYDAPGFNMYFSKIILIAKFLLIFLVMSSFDIFGFFGMEPPSYYRWCLENKLFACMMAFFFGNMLEAQLIASGAFEISLNDIPIWSKISTGRIPSPQELFQIIESHLQFSENPMEIGKNPDFVK
ncbi:unnamed protein product [Diamesa hyperborea]